MRHGRKSASKRFDGHKAAVAVDPDSPLITAATVLAGNAPDNTDALALVAESEENAQVVVEESIGDCAYGDGATRQAFADADRTLIAKVPDRPDNPFFVREDFAIDPVAQTCICPAGQTCTTVVTLKSFTDQQGERQILQGLRFAATMCAACPLRARCVRAGPGKGRTVRLHPQEALLQRARAVPTERGLRPLSQAAAGGRASDRAIDATGRATSTLHGACQDALSGAAGGDRGEPDAGGDQDRADAGPERTTGASFCPCVRRTDRVVGHFHGIDRRSLASHHHQAFTIRGFRLSF